MMARAGRPWGGNLGTSGICEVWGHIAIAKIFVRMRNDTVTPDSDPGSSLDSRLRGNDGETPITVRL
jgi:hypothetical protein